jgi:hypothetical protein
MLMRIIYSPIVPALVLALSLQACRDDKDEFVPYVDDQLGLQAIVEALPTASSTTVFTFAGQDLVSDRVLELSSGAKIILENNDALFQSLDGTLQPCSTCNEIKVEIKEAHKPSEWLGWGLPANDNNGTLLDHAPAISITVSCDQKPLELLPSRHIRTFVPHATLGNYYIAYPNSAWEPGAPNSVFSANWTIGGTSYTGYEFLVKKMGWTAAIRPFVPNGSLNFCVKLPEQYNQDNSRVYALCDNNQKNVAELEPMPDNPGNFCMANAPLGTTIRFVVISKTGPGYWLVDGTTVTATDNTTLGLVPTTSSAQDIIAFLQGL